MSIHEKINAKQIVIVASYVWGLYRPAQNDYVLKNMPKYLRYGGYRNTCYHY